MAGILVSCRLGQGTQITHSEEGAAPGDAQLCGPGVTPIKIS